jgi:hypothetical protein
MAHGVYPPQGASCVVVVVVAVDLISKAQTKHDAPRLSQQDAVVCVCVV